VWAVVNPGTEMPSRAIITIRFARGRADIGITPTIHKANRTDMILFKFFIILIFKKGFQTDIPL
jgi:hypothetical protein